MENSMEAPQKIKIELPYDPATIQHILLGTYATRLKSGYQNDIWTPMFIAALFIMTKTWKQP